MTWRLIRSISWLLYPFFLLWEHLEYLYYRRKTRDWSDSYWAEMWNKK